MGKSIFMLCLAVMVSVHLFSSASATQNDLFSINNPADLKKIDGIEARFLSPISVPTNTDMQNRAHKRKMPEWKLLTTSSVENYPQLSHLSWETDRPPFGEYDKITLHAIIGKPHGKLEEARKRKVLFMVPGTWNAGGWSQLTNAEVNSLVYFAVNGYDVFTITFRPSNLPNMTYSQFASRNVDISGTIGWTYGVYRDDIKACVNKIKKETRVEKIFMSGFSRGSSLMYIYASKYQEDLKGLVTFDGSIKDYPPDTDQAVDENTFNYYIFLLSQGLLPASDNCQGALCPPPGTMYQLLSEATWDYYDSWQLAGIVPLAQNMAGEPLPSEFETISDFVAHDAHYKWGDSVFSNYYGGNIQKEVLIVAMAELSRYWPTIQDFEQWQLESWDDVPYFDYDDNAIDLPAIAFLTPLFCPGGICLDHDIPNKTLNEDVTIHYLENYGHMDVMYGSSSLEDVKEPLLEWLNAHN